MSQKPLIIVGSGLAGLLAARLVADSRPVLILTKKTLNDSNTEQSQGGIAAVWSNTDSIASHVADTLKAGAEAGNKDAVQLLSARSKEAIEILIQLGVRFDKNEAGEFDLALEGAHSHPRVLHAGGDATGTEIQRALTREALHHPDITIIEHASLAEILTQADQVRGVRYYKAGNDLMEIDCDELILCTGGAGRLYKYTSNPATATGEGMILAQRAGARLLDLEFVQFHPTGLNREGAPNFLITEALRGAGAILRDHQGNAFMKEFDPRAELASRDVVSRAIYQVMRKGPVFLDATQLPHRLLKAHFPNIFHTCLQYGVNITEELIPVTPVAHYIMGGVVSDLLGRTNLKGLYVAGEAGRTGVHGANRLASNSLLEGAVFAMQVAKAVLADAQNTPDLWQPTALAANRAPQATEPVREQALTREEFQALMWDKVGIVRRGKELEECLLALGNPGYQPPEALDPAAFEFQNMRLLGRRIAQAALARKTSLGSHYRVDP